ncbi:MAG: hypothetical protein AB7O96_10780, partial [Pseudobdellovibrionaceae bacterium]
AGGRAEPFRGNIMAIYRGFEGRDSSQDTVQFHEKRGLYFLALIALNIGEFLELWYFSHQ